MLSTPLLPRIGFAVRILGNFACVGHRSGSSGGLLQLRSSLLRAAYVAHPEVWHHTSGLCFLNVRADVANRQQIRRKRRLFLSAAHFAFGMLPSGQERRLAYHPIRESPCFLARQASLGAASLQIQSNVCTFFGRNDVSQNDLSDRELT